MAGAARRPEARGAGGPRREPAAYEARRAPAPRGPQLPDDVTGQELDRQVRAELRSLSAANAELVARHLVMAGRLLDEDPELAYQHAAAASARAGRIAVVREAAGIAAYTAGHYVEALRELRAATRMSGSVEHLPVMADCERGLGRPERALELASSPEAARLDRSGQIELRIVASGARRDMGQDEAAVVTLQCRELNARQPSTPVARLRYAYAEALLHVGREDEARAWFERAAEADVEQATDAAERAAELAGVTFIDLEEEADGAPAAEDAHGAPAEDEPGGFEEQPAAAAGEPRSVEDESADPEDEPGGRQVDAQRAGDVPPPPPAISFDDGTGA